ncbi:MAG: hypothetical protein M3289_02680, partial [Actinomycetota bacterium]|nr:hypothetical protein [Actinomycetota bacterium]
MHEGDGSRSFTVRADDLNGFEAAVRVAEQSEEGLDAVEAESDPATAVQFSTDSLVVRMHGRDVHGTPVLEVPVKAFTECLEEAGVPVQLLPLGRDD